jgi:hypothetical protein
VAGVARYIVVLSAHADVFGVGITAIAGSMLVPPSCVMSCWIVPGGGFAGISGVESGKAAPLVGGPPGMELHTVVGGLPIGRTGDTVPVVLTTLGVGIVPNGAADIDGMVPVVSVMDDGEATGTAGVPGAIWPVGVEQVTTVPGIVGSDANGAGANVVPGAPGWVVAENGLGP